MKKGDTIKAFYRGRRNWGFYFEPEPGELIMIAGLDFGKDLTKAREDEIRKGDLCELEWIETDAMEGWAYSRRLKTRTLSSWLSFYNWILD